MKRAISRNQIDLVKDYLKSGHDINTTYASGETILHFAVLQNNIEIVQLLLDTEANMDHQSKKGPEIPMENNLILSKWRTSSGATPFHYAAGVGNIIMIRLFVEKKRAQNLDIGMHEQCGTSLTWATEAGHVDVVAFLIEQGADVNVLDMDGNSLPMIAVFQLTCASEKTRLVSILKLFHQVGMNWAHRNHQNLNISDIAPNEEFKSIIASITGVSETRPSSIDHLFSWDIKASRKEWPYDLSQGSTRRLPHR